MDTWMDTVRLAAALGSGLNAGFFFSFSFVVMRALGRVPPEHGIAAMQRINVVVLNGWFLAAFLGTAAACVVLVASALPNLSALGALQLVSGAALYLVGVIFVTIAFNVPLNNRLARADPGSVEGAHLWAHYLSAWTRWNHVRTACPLVAAALLA